MVTLKVFCGKILSYFLYNLFLSMHVIQTRSYCIFCFSFVVFYFIPCELMEVMTTSIICAWSFFSFCLYTNMPPSLGSHNASCYNCLSRFSWDKRTYTGHYLGLALLFPMQSIWQYPLPNLCLFRALCNFWHRKNENLNEIFYASGSLS